MPEGDGDAAALAARRSPVTPRHLRVGCGSVEEDEPVRIEIELPFEPGQTGCLHVRSILLGRMADGFLRMMPWRLKMRDRLLTSIRRPRSAGRSRKFVQEQSGLRLVGLSDQRGLRLDGL